MGQRIQEKFSLPSIILDAKKQKDLVAAGQPNPVGRREGIVILSYEYAARIADTLRAVEPVQDCGPDLKLGGL